MARRSLIVQHCYGVPGLGGPMSGLRRLLGSSLAQKYRFETCFQPYPAGGINLNLIATMARQIRAYRPDLLHVRGLGNEGFHGYLAGRMAGCSRILVSVHGMVRDSVYYPNRWRQWIVSQILEPFTPPPRGRSVLRLWLRRAPRGDCPQYPAVVRIHPQRRPIARSEGLPDPRLRSRSVSPGRMSWHST